MRWSPSFHFLRDAWLPALRRTGVDADLALEAWGWFPVGKGLMRATIRGGGARRLGPLALADGPSRYSVPLISGHLATNAWLVGQFGLARVDLEPGPQGGAVVTVTPRSG